MRILRYLFLTISLLTTFSLFAAHRQSIDSLLRVLDAEIDSDACYISRMQEEAGVMLRLAREAKTPRHRFRINEQLSHIYRFYNYDSARYFVNENIRIAAGLGDSMRFEAEHKSAQLDIKNNEFTRALDAIDRLWRMPHDSLQADLLRMSQLRILYFAGRDELTGICHSVDQTRLDSLLFYFDDHKERIPASQWDIPVYLYELQGDRDEEFRYLQEMFDRQTPGTRAYSFFGVRLAMLAARMDDVDASDYYLVLSAISDRRGMIRNNMTTYYLARRLYERGDIDLAFRCTRLMLEHASFMHSNVTKIHIANLVNQIQQAYQEQQTAYQARLKAYIGLVIVLFFGLGGAMFFMRSQMRRLRKARGKLLAKYRHEVHLNNELTRARAELSSHNRVREEYIALFLAMRPYYLGCHRDFASLVIRQLRSAKIAELTQQAQQELNRLRELDRSYAEFDEMFLTIVPSFIDEFNALLRPEARLEPPRGQLSVELRIFALIRLGIADTNRIAGYLGYSVSTIYNYRSRLRANACCTREEFEAKVLAIGRK